MVQRPEQAVDVACVRRRLDRSPALGAPADSPRVSAVAMPAEVHDRRGHTVSLNQPLLPPLFRLAVQLAPERAGTTIRADGHRPSGDGSRRVPPDSG